MERKSLQFKIREVNKYGTLRSFSQHEALEFTQKEFIEDPEYSIKECNHIKDAYARGMILCSFIAYPEMTDKTEFNQVRQLTTSLADFVLNIAYPFLTV